MGSGKSRLPEAVRAPAYIREKKYINVSEAQYKMREAVKDVRVGP